MPKIVIDCYQLGNNTAEMSVTAIYSNNRMTLIEFVEADGFMQPARRLEINSEKNIIRDDKEATNERIEKKICIFQI